MKRFALLALLGLAGTPSALAETLTFDGRVEAITRAEVSSRLDGVVTALRFEGGETVEAGAALLEMDAAPFQLAVEAAKAETASAAADLKLAEQKAARARELASRKVASTAEVQTAEAALDRAKAGLAAAKIVVRQAELDLSHTVIRAPIAGTISRPSAAPGSFLEAEAGPPLATIVQLDPVLVAYKVPYAVRLASLRGAGATTLEDLFERITLRLVLPGGEALARTAKPQFASAALDETGSLTIWAKFENPDGLLRPGMKLRVLSDIAAP